MQFSNRLKGKIAESLVKSLLEDAGYRVVPLGIEEVIREVNTKGEDEYTKLGLPKSLRCLPDFFVANEGLDSAWMLEVKFRKEWNKETRLKLEKRLLAQARLWHPLLVLVALGKPSPEGIVSPQGCIGVARLHSDGEDLCVIREPVRSQFTLKKDKAPVYWRDIEWNQLERLQDVFSLVTKRYSEQTLVKAIQVLKHLESIGLYE